MVSIKSSNRWVLNDRFNYTQKYKDINVTQKDDLTASQRNKKYDGQDQADEDLAPSFKFE